MKKNIPVATTNPVASAPSASKSPKARTADKSAPKVNGQAKVVVRPLPVKEVKEPKTRKPKLVRDSFTFPEADYGLLSELKQRALAEGQEIKKSELLRAGLKALAAMPTRSFLASLTKVDRIKTGRPGKS